MREIIAQRPSSVRVQIFGTDIDNAAIAFARHARYRKMTGVTPERLAKWFSPDGDAYCPVRVIREMCVFSTHSVTKDPPFSKLDLISCRNLLIYMNAALQDRVLKTFHYALKPDGMLFLGPSESMTRQSRLFDDSDKKHRIFRREDAAATLPDVALRAASLATPDLPPAGLAAGSGDDRIDKTARRMPREIFPRLCRHRQAPRHPALFRRRGRALSRTFIGDGEPQPLRHSAKGLAADRAKHAAAGALQESRGRA